MNSKILFAIGLFFCLTPWASPPSALLAGLLFGAIATHPYKNESRKLSKVLLQSAVVGLGFGMNLQEVVHAGKSGFVYTAIGIAFAMSVGTLLGKALSVQNRPAFLISTGTAICGGSAIAAVGPITGATEDEMSVSLGTIFILNSVALLTFPPIGLWLHLARRSSASGPRWPFTTPVRSWAPPSNMALWPWLSALRSSWRAPCGSSRCRLGQPRMKGSKTKIQWPWFILFFCLAAVANTYLYPGQRRITG